MRLRLSALVAFRPPKASATSVLVVLGLWLLLFHWFTRIDVWLHSLMCSFPGSDTDYHVLLVADPQLVDNHTYPGRPWPLLKLSQVTADDYMRRNYRSLLTHLRPEAVFFLGDLMDNGRSSSDEFYARELERFKRVFAPGTTETLTLVPGNHDIGYGDGVRLPSLQRFETFFGKPNQRIARKGHELIFLDTISLSNTQDEAIYGEARRLLEEIGREPKMQPRILFHHVPLYRDPSEQPCGKYRESRKFPVAKGHQYQTVIDPSLSLEILEKIRPDYIFSGDDHDYCEVVHRYTTGEAVEVTVKSFSLAMGIKYPAVELLSVGEAGGDAAVAYSLCYLGRPFRDIAAYVVAAVANGLWLLWSFADRRSGAKLDFPRLLRYTAVEFAAVTFMYWIIK
ncbi:hypothetical protein KL941_002086 [Ogataea angusta]|nr:hypothetical protein KL941_002086 [Ogataea angusta]